jgi:hypothetical protein
VSAQHRARRSPSPRSSPARLCLALNSLRWLLPRITPRVPRHPTCPSSPAPLRLALPPLRSRQNTPPACPAGHQAPLPQACSAPH